MLEREVKLGRDTSILRVESGLGASGIPHVGSLGDAVRAYGVKLALQDLGYKSELIAYSDDMDGLRKIPEGFPKSLSLCAAILGILNLKLGILISNPLIHLYPHMIKTPRDHLMNRNLFYTDSNPNQLNLYQIVLPLCI